MWQPSVKLNTNNQIDIFLQPKKKKEEEKKKTK